MKLTNFKVRNVVFILLISVIPLLAVYLPFALHLKSVWEIPLKDSGMQQIFANWDGPNYVYNAITFYDPIKIAKTPFDGKDASYYPSHLPGYSVLIWLSSLVFGVFWGAFVVNILSNVLLNSVFYQFIKPYTKHALFLTFAFTVFPARFWIVRSVISPEMLMLICVLGTLFYWEKKRYWISGIFALLGVFFKFHMLIFTPVFLAVFVEKLIRKKPISPSMVVPALGALIGFVGVSGYYYFVTGRWDAFFLAQQVSGLATSIPLGMFNYASKWVATGWTETTVLYLFALVLLIVKLVKDNNRTFFWFAFGYTMMLSAIPHLDIARYTMPLAPVFFAVFHENLSGKLFRYGLIAALPILYLHTINFIMTNQAPITDWSIFR